MKQHRLAAAVALVSLVLAGCDSQTSVELKTPAQKASYGIGLNMGKVVRPASFHVAGYALMSSNTLAEGFMRLVRYQRIIAESADLSFRLLPEGYALILTVHGDHLPPTRQSAEASLASALAQSVCLGVYGFVGSFERVADIADVPPTQVAMPHPPGLAVQVHLNVALGGIFGAEDAQPGIFGLRKPRVVESAHHQAFGVIQKLVRKTIQR